MNEDNNPITYFAVTNWRDIRKIFGIKRKNRRGHIYLIGKTGTGKSTLIENMVASDLNQGNGLALIDPHGDLCESILHLVPEDRIKDVIYFNPADLEYPIGFNPLEDVHPDSRHLVASGIISVLKKVWPDYWGPRLEHILRYTLLTLLECPGSTLLDAPKLLTDRDARNAFLEIIQSPHLKEFWLFEFNKLSPWLKSDSVAPILNKLSQFLTCTPIRNIVEQKESAFDLRKVMDEGKIFIANLSKGKIGEDSCSLLGTMLVTKMQLAALSRANIPESKRRGFYLYVDEVHNFLTLSFADILSESRKYGLNLTLAHQYIEQLDERIRAAIFGNVGTLISFRVGAEDAKYLAREFYPVFHESDIINLPNYHIYLKLMIDGITSKPFSAVTLPGPEATTSYTEKIIEASRRRYGNLRKETEETILFKGNIEAERQSRQGMLFS